MYIVICILIMLLGVQNIHGQFNSSGLCVVFSVLPIFHNQLVVCVFRASRHNFVTNAAKHNRKREFRHPEESVIIILSPWIHDPHLFLIKPSL